MLQKISLFLFCLGIGLRYSGGTATFISPLLLILIATVLEIGIKKNPLSALKLPFSALALLLVLFLSLTYTKSFFYGIQKIGILAFWFIAFSVLSSNITTNFPRFLKYLAVSFVIVLLLFYYNFGGPIALLQNVHTY